MDGLEYKEFIGKKVYVILKTNRVYTGIVQSVDGGIILMIDKYHRPVMFNVSEISSLEVEKDER
jgi:small nuclear ribonucleoprotein (snRNP)-like protein